ncbi:MAG: hypothetical protein WA547_06420 [Thermoplasmata archaeon]
MYARCRSPTNPKIGLVRLGFLIALGVGLLASTGLVVSAASSPAPGTVRGSPPVASDLMLIAGTILPASPSIDNGQSVLLSSAVSGGTPPYTYAWYESPDGAGPCPGDGGQVGGNSSTVDTGALTSGGGPYYYCYTVTDNSSDAAGSAWDPLTVNPVLGAGAATPASPVIDYGQSVTLTANPSSGSPPYSDQWYWSSTNGGSCGSGTPLKVGSSQSTGSEITGPGTYYYCYLVTDSSVGDQGAESASSGWDGITVNSALSAPAISVAPMTIDSGQKATLSTTTSFTGGTGPYSCEWLSEAPGGNYANLGSSFGCSPGDLPTVGTGTLSPTGTWSFELQVTDSSGTPNTATSGAVTVAVASALGTPSVNPLNPSIDVGQSVAFTSDWSGGLPDYMATLNSGSSATCSADTVEVQTLSSLPGGSASFAAVSPASDIDYCIVVTDSSTGAPAASETSSVSRVVVHSALTAPAAPMPSAASLDADQSMTVGGTIPSTGTPSYAWQWLVSINGGSYKDATQCGTSASGSGASAGASETCSIPINTLTASSSYNFELQVTDGASSPESATSPASSTVTVNSAFSAGSVSPSSPSIDSGQSITLSTNPSGGTTPYSYQWYSSAKGSGACDAGTTHGTGATQVVTPSATTHYCYTASDSSHPPVMQSSSWDGVTVNPALSSGAASPGSPTIDFGQSITLSGNPASGTPPYSYQWYASDSSSGSCASGTPLGTNPTQATGTEITGPGSFYFCYVAADSSLADGGHESAPSAWDRVTVNPTLSAPSAPTVTAPALDVNQALSASGTVPSTGTAPYGWQWLMAVNGGTYADASLCAVAHGSGAPAGGTETCGIAGGALTTGDNYAFELKITDTAPTPATAVSAASSTVTVHPALTAAGAPTPSSTALDADQAMTVTGKLASTGTPNYAWQWLISINAGADVDAAQCGASASGTGAVGGATETCTIPGDTLTASTSYTFELKVTDSASTPEVTTSAASSKVTTSSALTAGLATPISPAVDVGQSVTLYSNPSGGTLPYSLQWYSSTSGTGSCNSGTPLGTAATQPLSPTTSAYYCYSVTDSAHSKVTQLSGWNGVLVDPTLTPPATPISSTTALDANQAWTITGIIPSTGTPTYSWQWLISVAGGAFANATQCATNNGTGAQREAPESCTIAPNTLTSGESYALEFLVRDNATLPETGTSPASPTLAVSPALTAPPAPIPSATLLDSDLPLTVTGIIPMTGTPAYSWQWLISVGGGAYVDATECSVNSGSGAAAGATEICNITAGTLTAGQTYAFEFLVTDSASTPESQPSAASPTVSPNPAFSAGSASPGAPAIDSGQSVTLTANPSGGSGAYAYQWYSGSTASGCTGLGSPISGATASTFAASPTTSTYYCYVVEDTTSATATSLAVQIIVNPALTPSNSPTSSATNVAANEELTLTAGMPSTGTPDYSWQWLVSVDGGPFEDATQCALNTGSGAIAGATESCAIAPGTLTAGDTYAFELRISDSSATPATQTSLATATITVGAASASPPAASFPWFWVYAAITLAAIAAIVVLTLFTWRKRRRAPPSVPPTVTGVAEESPSAASAPARPGPVYLEMPPAYAPPAPPASRPTVAAEAVVSPPAPPPTPTRVPESEVDQVMAEIERISTEIAKRPPKKGADGTTNGGASSPSAADE